MNAKAFSIITAADPVPTKEGYSPIPQVRDCVVPSDNHINTKKALANECKGFFNNYGSGPCPDEGGILSHPARAGLYCTIRYLYKQQKKPQNLI
jgi:hypothetical protein